MIVRLAARVTGPVAPVVVAALAGIACVAALFVDPTRLPLPACPFRAVTGLDCPGCGATRAAHHLLHGRIGVAADYNALFVVLVPVAAVWAVWAFSADRRTAVRISAVGVGLGVTAVAVAFMVLRNLPWEPFSYLGT